MSKSKKQICIIDDDKSVCMALSVLLGTYGFAVRVFTSAKDFFQRISDNACGCILLDIHMPQMDGWKALSLILKSGSACPVIIISADKNGGLRERALIAGAAGYLQKPFNDKELVGLIEGAFKNNGDM